MYVAICDNEMAALDLLQLQLEQNGRAKSIKQFLFLRQLQNAIAEGENFDLLFMDIEWDQPQNGIDFAAAVNEMCPDTQIIFVTGHPDRYYQQIFLKPLNLCGCLEKPVDAEILEKLLQKALGVIQTRKEQKLLVQHKGTIEAVFFHKIRYLESRGHQLTIHTAEGSLTCYEKLENLKERLAQNFYQCHKSYLVNMDYIRRIEKNSILLKTGEELPVSKAKYAETRAAFFRYIGETL